MAERRMFAKSVVNSARFLRMPASARLLYYDLGMAADDDGVVEAFTVMRTTGASDGDLNLLVRQGFIAVLNEDQVAYICDWRRNNQIKKDRYRPSMYADLLERYLLGDNPEWNQNGSNLEPQYSTDQVSTDQNRIDQDSSGEVSTEPEPGGAFAPTRARFLAPTVQEVQDYAREQGGSIDADRFVDYYTANGWMMSGQIPMRSWKAAVRRWMSNGYDHPRPANPALNYEQRPAEESGYKSIYVDLTKYYEGHGDDPQ